MHSVQCKALKKKKTSSFDYLKARHKHQPILINSWFVTLPSAVYRWARLTYSKINDIENKTSMLRSVANPRNENNYVIRFWCVLRLGVAIQKYGFPMKPWNVTVKMIIEQYFHVLALALYKITVILTSRSIRG